MSIRKTVATVAVSAGLLATLLPLTPADAATRTLAVALYENGTRLGRFDVAKPSGMTAIGGIISGLDADNFLLGIDRRPQDGKLYGIGNAGGIYRLAGNRATQVGQLGDGPLPVGVKYDVDFNPAANALRLVSSDGAINLRIPFGDDEPVDGGEVEDEPLTFVTATGDPGPAPTGDGITAVAYTNNDLTTTTGTTLFDIDSNLDQLVMQVPANAGFLSPVGKLGTGAGVDSGLDIYTDLSGGSTSAAVSNTAYAAVPLGTTYRFAKVDLLTGRASSVGTFSKRVTDIAVDLDSSLM